MPDSADEATCIAERPNQLFNCVEVIDLCAHGTVATLFSDVQRHGTWEQQADPLRVTLRIYDEAELTQDGFVDLAVVDDGTLSSDEVYGGRPFVPGGRALCP